MGSYIYRLDLNGADFVNPCVECLKWYENDLRVTYTYSDASVCPCSRRQARRDVNFRRCTFPRGNDPDFSSASYNSVQCFQSTTDGDEGFRCTYISGALVTDYQNLWESSNFHALLLPRSRRRYDDPYDEWKTTGMIEFSNVRCSINKTLTQYTNPSLFTTSDEDASIAVLGAAVDLSIGDPKIFYQRQAKVDVQTSEDVLSQGNDPIFSMGHYKISAMLQINPGFGSFACTGGLQTPKYETTNSMQIPYSQDPKKY
eukprot:XP_011671610.1 PREDICTED: uncharacterized protein LOC105441809 [Strongylocentrotus purpuratus]